MKKIFQLIFVFCLFFSAPLIASKKELSCKEAGLESSLHETKIPFFIAAPKGWQCIQDKAQLPARVEMVFIGAGKGQFTPSINLATEETSLSIDEYIRLAKEYHSSQGETKCVNLGTVETNAGAAKLMQIERKTQWGVVRFLQASLIREGVAHVITATCLAEDYNTLSPQFIKAIQSFTINSI